MERRSETKDQKMLERVRKASAKIECPLGAAALGVFFKRRGWIKAASLKLEMLEPVSGWHSRTASV